MSAEFTLTERNRIRRLPKRGYYDKETIYQIIDEALICHVGLAENNQPFVIPTLIARVDDTILLHGASTSRMLKHIEAGHEVCVTVTHIDGLVLARSVFHHSMNYRSAVVFGQGYLLTDEQEKWAGLQAFTDKLLPGRWGDARVPNAVELKATSIVAIPMASASAKVRTGGPADDEEDLDLPVWAGVIPIIMQRGRPEEAADLKEGIELPNYIEKYVSL